MSKRQSRSEIPVQCLVSVAQTAFSCGVGMLLAGKLRRDARQNTALALLSVGALATLPLIYEALFRRFGGPTTEHGMRKTLDSIRNDRGISEDVDLY